MEYREKNRVTRGKDQRALLPLEGLKLILLIKKDKTICKGKHEVNWPPWFFKANTAQTIFEKITLRKWSLKI